MSKKDHPPLKKLPIGIQSIRKILEKGEYVYVDKTGFIKQLVDEGSPYFFMSRPRRFGKSLFISTLKEVLSGEKELFKGCAIYESDYQWQKCSVLRFDFSQIASHSPEAFSDSLKRSLVESGQFYGLSIEAPSVKEGLKSLVTQVFHAKNRPVVVLIDEYDHAIIRALNDLAAARKNREILKDFFTMLKSLDEYLKLVFITGISKFSQVSLFSGLNNLNDITMDPKYAGMMGYTDEELRKAFGSHINAIAQERGEESEAVVQEVRSWYNGYRFSEDVLCVLNPFSTLKFMQIKTPKAYWYSTGTPSFLIEQLKKHPQSMIALDGTTAREDELMDISSLEEIDLKALMYQTGYFTIQGYHQISKRYYLGLPNEEVRTAFLNSLVKHFTENIDVRSSEKFVKALERYQIEVLFEHIRVGLSSFAYQVFAGAKERTYQGMLLSMLFGMGFDPLSEKPTNRGRIDVALEMPKAIYILELKLDSTADAALSQIHKKQYYKPYTHKGKEIVIIGANFSSEQRNVSEWKGELLSKDLGSCN